MRTPLNQKTSSLANREFGPSILLASALSGITAIAGECKLVKDEVLGFALLPSVCGIARLVPPPKLKLKLNVSEPHLRILTAPTGQQVTLVLTKEASPVGRPD